MAGSKVVKNNSPKKRGAVNKKKAPEKLVTLSKKEFQKHVDKWKKGRGEDLLLAHLLDDPYVVRAIVAWKNVPRKICPIVLHEGLSPWSIIGYPVESWMKAARVPREEEKSVITCVLQNDLVYPDGTIPDVVREYLEESANLMLGRDEKGGGSDD